MTASSIERRLRQRVGVVLLAVLVPLGALAAWATLRDVEAFTDQRLRQTARSLADMLAALPPQGAVGSPALQVPVRDKRPDESFTYETEVGFRALDAARHVRLLSANMADLPTDLPTDDDVHTIELHRRTWHLYTLRDGRSGLEVTVAERHDTRRDVANAVAVERSLPVVLGVPALFLAVGWAVRRGLRPLRELASQLRQRQPGSSDRVVLAHAPPDIRPIVDRLNARIEQLEHALDRERRFSADVAHELRTPLAATMINLDSVAAFGASGELAAALPAALDSLRVLERRTDQLVLLARLDDEADVPRTQVDLRALAQQVMMEWRPTLPADAFSITLAGDGAVHVAGYPEALAALLRNLLENAARHVPHGGHIEVDIHATGPEALLVVTDNGPGIPADRRAAVFARFQREGTALGDGFGVGLSIVQRVAQMHGATVSLEDAPSGQGLRVSVRFSRAPLSRNDDNHELDG